MKALIIITGISLFFTSCSINQEVAGKYMAANNPNYLQLKKGGTFIYEYRAMHLYQHSIGKWEKRKDNQIVLNTPIKSTVIPINVVQQSTGMGNNISINLKISDSKSLSDYKCRVYINDVAYCTKRCDSLNSITVNSPISNMYFMIIKEPQEITNTYVSLPLTTNKYSPKLKIGNKLEVKIDVNDNYFYYKSFNNDTLIVKHNAIKMFNGNKGKWEKLSKVPESTNIFSRYKDNSTELNTIR